MNYWMYFFSPKTWKTFCEKGGTTGGVRQRQRNTLREKLKEGDYLIAYCAKFSRFIGVLEFKGRIREESEPYFTEQNDPFVWRFDVEKRNFVDFSKPEKAVPLENMLEDTGAIEQFKQNADTEGATVGQIRTRTLASFFGQGSLRLIEEGLGEKVFEVLRNNTEAFPLSEAERSTIDSADNTDIDIESELTIETEEEQTGAETGEENTHYKKQASLTELGAKWGYKVWLPKNDRERVINLGNFNESILLDELPMAYAEEALKVVKNIDVIWTQGNSMKYAFEVEHTTGITPGLLRLNDLNCLLPDITTNFVIVGDYKMYKKFKREIRRPTFEPILDKTGFLSYETFDRLINHPDIAYLNHRKLDDSLDLP